MTPAPPPASPRSSASWSGQLSLAWPAISELLDAALALPLPERQAWLEGLSGAAAAHRDTLRALLATQAAVETDDFLAELPRLQVNGGRETDGSLAEGVHVGAYRLIAEIARGGMGTVWLAERSDGLMKRRVALKLPRIVWGNTFAERLAREREILSSLEHAHIARLYDAGIDAQGRPFLAMEFVEGEAIDVYCRGRSLALRERLLLLLQVMAAVSHAHSRLVVHRDLKPGNILVTQSGQVRLLDFGIAKLLEGEHTRQTALTELGGRALTLDYASPEQIRGEPLGTASDIYSMAVVAYELLADARPYKLRRDSAAALEEAIEQIESPLASVTAQDPASKRALRGDLDAILNKALKKAPSQRYPTMEAFAHDLQRHLDQQPVQAQPDRLGYRTAKFVRRHRLQVTAGGLVLTALIVGASAALWQAHESALQAQRARTEAATALAVQSFIESVFRANSGDQDDPEKARNTTARELLDRGAERMSTELRDAPEARLRVLNTLAEMYQGMTLLDKAAELQRQRVALARQSTGPQSAELARALADWGSALALVDRRKEAMEAAAEAGRLLDALGDHASSARFSVDLTLALLYQRSDFELGLAAAQRAAANAGVRNAGAERARALQVQSEIAASAGKDDLARDGALAAIRLVEADASRGANNLSALYVSLADAQAGLGALDAAEASYQKAMAVARQRNALAPIYLHTAERRYGSFLRRNGRYRESMETHRPGYEWARTQPSGFGMMPPTLVVEYGRALVAYGRTEAGLAVFDEALAMKEAMAEAPEVAASVQLFRAQGLIELGRGAEAGEAIAEAEAFFASGAMGPAPLLRAVRRQLLTAQGHPELALSDFQAARAQQGKPAEPAATDPPRVWIDVARLHLDLGQPEEAGTLARQALARIEASVNRPGLAEAEAAASFIAGCAALKQGPADEARRLLGRSAALHRIVFDPQHSLQLADVLGALARAERTLGDRHAADAALAEAKAIHASHARIGEPHRAWLASR